MRARDRRGMAIFIVVMITAILATFISIMLETSNKAKRATAITLERAQSRFLAQGAKQHFLLKFKLLPTELYDAVAYSMGKNPYFDFSARIATAQANAFTLPRSKKPDRGPMFFTGSTNTVVEVRPEGLFVDRAKEGENLYLNPQAGFSGDPGQNRDRMNVMLHHYELDIATGYPDFQDLNKAIVVVSSTPHQDKARIGRPDDSQGEPLEGWRDPFDGEYSVEEIRILGVGGTRAGRKYQADSVLLSSRATVARDDQVSLVTAGADGRGQLIRPISVWKSDLRAEEGWVDVRFDGTENAVKSAKRTDVATDILFINRKTR